jgi:pyruvate dehydrogenase E2 component (dihydrolipoamide acetyltransferase)
MYSIEHFMAVINPPEAGILACGAVEERPVAEDGELRVGTRMKVTLSCDHRAVDGAIGAEFLGRVKNLLESPRLLTI